MTHKFLLPIETIDHSVVTDVVLKDLEVTSSKAETETKIETSQDTDKKTPCLYDVIYKPSHKVDELVKERMCATYTTDVSFLQQTQAFLDKVGTTSQTNNELNLNHANVIAAYDTFEEITTEQDFHSKYQYIEVNMFKSLNTSPHFMQMLSFYNMLSPVITLLTPIVILVLPFFLIRYQGVSLSLSAYLGTIKHILRNHAIGQLATSFGSVSWDKRIYLIITVSFYILQVYQNALSCYRFTVNMKHIHKQLFTVRDYLRDTCSVINSVKEIVRDNGLTKYEQFVESNDRCLISLRTLLAELECITPLRVSIPKACQVGDVMRLYYSIRHDDRLRSAVDYSFKLNSYIIAMTRVGSNGNLHNTTFTEKHRWKATDMKYPHHMASTDTAATTADTVGNDFTLDRPIVLTGPNASGKTTLLKSAILNTLISQQFGRGFYNKLVMKPYDKFHCYLDVPDTSGRDSLFQAEAKRCLEVVRDVKEEGMRVFCVFDELYSGTNPTEATVSAYALTKHLAKRKNASFIITTHFHEFCKLCKTNKIGIANCQMGWVVKETANKNEDVQFTYKMTIGISTLQGAVRVLEQSGYPSTIVDDARRELLHRRRSRT